MAQQIWIIGGDLRSHWAAQALRKSGLAVHTHHVPEEPMEALPEFLPQVLLPFPSIVGQTLRGEGAVPIAALLSRLDRTSRVFGGMLGVWKAAMEDRGASVFDLYGTEPLTTGNAAITAEGALDLAMSLSPITLHDSLCLVIGYGWIGKILARRLSGLGADVTVAVRKAADSALAEAMGHMTEETHRYLHGLHHYDFIFNTVPARVLDEAQLRQLSPECMLMELASAPGGFSPSEASALGLQAVNAAGLPGRCAPKSAGILYAQSVLSILKKEAAP